MVVSEERNQKERKILTQKGGDSMKFLPQLWYDRLARIFLDSGRSEI
jgi:hypothetical protein